MKTNLNHPELIDSLRKAYSAEKAAALAYRGHARSLKSHRERVQVQSIEQDEWNHRKGVRHLMQEYGIEPSRWYEFQYHVLGQFLAVSCRVIGRFMPYFFAGKLESGNVCEYFVMIRYFHSLGIRKHDALLHEMGIREKEHEVYFADLVKEEKWLPWFERVFNWGPDRSGNDVDLNRPRSPADSDVYCRGKT